MATGKSGKIRQRFGSKSNEKCNESESKLKSLRKHNNQIAKELSDIVVYLQVRLVISIYLTYSINNRKISRGNCLRVSLCRRVVTWKDMINSAI